MWPLWALAAAAQVYCGFILGADWLSGREASAWTWAWAAVGIVLAVLNSLERAVDGLIRRYGGCSRIRDAR
jgi:hypothetical protein